MSHSRYYLQVEKGADKEKIIPFLEQHYNRHEPLQLMYLAKHVEKISPAHRRGLASYVYKSQELLLASGTCFTLHMQENDEIVATMLIIVEGNLMHVKKIADVVNALRVNKDGEIALYEALNILPSNSPLVIDVFRTVMFPALAQAKIFERYPAAGKAGNIMFLCVGEEHRGQGLAKLLIEKAVDWAKKSDVDVLYGLFTSELAKRAAEKSEFKSIKDIDLMGFKNELEKPIFEGMEPRSISIMARQM